MLRSFASLCFALGVLFVCCWGTEAQDTDLRSCPPQAEARVCPTEHPLLPPVEQRQETGLPLGCPIKSVFLPNGGWGNRIGLFVTLAALGELLQRPIVVTWRDFMSGWDNVKYAPLYSEAVFLSAVVHYLKMSPVPDYGYRWASLLFMANGTFNAIQGIDRLEPPPWEQWPEPKVYVDIVPETAYIWLLQSGLLTRFSSSNPDVGCISMSTWVDAVMRVAAHLRPTALERLALGLPSGPYIAVYVRDLGDPRKRGEVLSKADLAHATRLTLDSAKQPLLQLSATLNRTFHWLVVSKSARAVTWIRNLLRPHGVSCGALHDISWPPSEHEGVLRLLRDWHALAAAAAVVILESSGMTSFPLTAKWVYGGSQPQINLFNGSWEHGIRTLASSFCLAHARRERDCVDAVCLSWNVDSPGNDIRQVPGVADAAACQRECAVTDGCEFFTYATEACPRAALRRLCFLKSATWPLIPSFGLVSGPKACSGLGLRNFFPPGHHMAFAQAVHAYVHGMPLGRYTAGSHQRFGRHVRRGPPR